MTKKKDNTGLNVGGILVFSAIAAFTLDHFLSKPKLKIKEYDYDNDRVLVSFTGAKNDVWASLDNQEMEISGKLDWKMKVYPAPGTTDTLQFDLYKKDEKVRDYLTLTL